MLKPISKKKNLKITLIAMKAAMAVAVVMIIYNVVGIFKSKSLMEKCTTAMWGVVDGVEEKHINRHGTSYKAYVTSEYAPSMRFESIYTRHKYTEGDRVQIDFDPDDMSNYYIEYAEPAAEDITFILSGSALLIAMLILHVITGKQYKKLCSEEALNEQL